jgi:hypothetical protein
MTDVEAAPVKPEDFVAHLREMLVRLKVTKVVLVDDLVVPDVDAAAILKIVLEKPGSVATLEPFFQGIALNADNAALADQLGAILGDTDAESRTKIGQALAQLTDNPAEASDILQLRQLVPEEVKVDFLTPQEWAEQGQGLIAQCTPEALTLFLFDQQLNVDGQGLGFESGADIIKGISQAEPEGFGVRWFCGMLSHTLSKGDEVDSWRTLAADHQIGLQFFMPIAKDNLREAADFFQALYRTLINTYCERMKILAGDGFRASLDAALKRFGDLDPIDFEHMVVNSSETEGVSELDTMLRIYAILHRDEMKAEFLKQATFTQFSAAATAVKRVVDIRRRMPTDAQQRLHKLRGAELYEADELVNAYHDPLRNGDLFAVGEGAGNIFVLIAQPCDVMVRSNGKRNRENNFKVAVIAPVDVVSIAQAQSQERAGLGFELPNFGPDGDQMGLVSFPKATVANLHVLDLAVLSSDGRCEIEPEKLKQAVPTIPTRAWEGRATELAKHFQRVTKSVEDARKQHNDVVAKLLSDALLPRVAMSAAFKDLGSYDTGKFAYPIRRRGRVRDPLAASLLSAFSRYLGRDAQEHDFSGVPDGEALRGQVA